MPNTGPAARTRPREGAGLAGVASLPEFALDAEAPAGAACLAAGAATFRAAAAYVRALPYGRPRGDDLVAVLREGRGTCSSKHALLAALAHDHGRDEVALTVGLYMMCEANTPGVGPVLADFGLEAVPEAHCYLLVRDPRLGERRVDVTGLGAGAESPFDALLEEHVVAPDALAAWKAPYHRRALTAWALGWGFEPAAVWAAREACVAALARSAPEGGP